MDRPKRTNRQQSYEAFFIDKKDSPFKKTKAESLRDRGSTSPSIPNRLSPKTMTTTLNTKNDQANVITTKDDRKRLAKSSTTTRSRLTKRAKLADDVTIRQNTVGDSGKKQSKSIEKMPQISISVPLKPQKECVRQDRSTVLEPSLLQSVDILSQERSPKSPSNTRARMVERYCDIELGNTDNTDPCVDDGSKLTASSTSTLSQDIENRLPAATRKLINFSKESTIKKFDSKKSQEFTFPNCRSKGSRQNDLDQVDVDNDTIIAPRQVPLSTSFSMQLDLDPVDVEIDNLFEPRSSNRLISMQIHLDPVDAEIDKLIKPRQVPLSTSFSMQLDLDPVDVEIDNLFEPRSSNRLISMQIHLDPVDVKIDNLFEPRTFPVPRPIVLTSKYVKSLKHITKKHKDERTSLQNQYATISVQIIRSTIESFIKKHYVWDSNCENMLLFNTVYQHFLTEHPECFCEIYFFGKIAKPFFGNYTVLVNKNVIYPNYRRKNVQEVDTDQINTEQLPFQTVLKKFKDVAHFKSIAPVIRKYSNKYERQVRSDDLGTWIKTLFIIDAEYTGLTAALDIYMFFKDALPNSEIDEKVFAKIFQRVFPEAIYKNYKHNSFYNHLRQRTAEEMVFPVEIEDYGLTFSYGPDNNIVQHPTDFEALKTTDYSKVYVYLVKNGNECLETMAVGKTIHPDLFYEAEGRIKKERCTVRRTHKLGWNPDPNTAFCLGLYSKSEEIIDLLKRWVRIFTSPCYTFAPEKCLKILEPHIAKLEEHISNFLDFFPPVSTAFITKKLGHYAVTNGMDLTQQLLVFGFPGFDDEQIKLLLTKSSEKKLNMNNIPVQYRSFDRLLRNNMKSAEENLGKLANKNRKNPDATSAKQKTKDSSTFKHMTGRTGLIFFYGPNNEIHVRSISENEKNDKEFFEIFIYPVVNGDNCIETMTVGKTIISDLLTAAQNRISTNGCTVSRTEKLDWKPVAEAAFSLELYSESKEIIDFLKRWTRIYTSSCYSVVPEECLEILEPHIAKLEEHISHFLDLFPPISVAYIEKKLGHYAVTHGLDLTRQLLVFGFPGFDDEQVKELLTKSSEKTLEIYNIPQ